MLVDSLFSDLEDNKYLEPAFLDKQPVGGVPPYLTPRASLPFPILLTILGISACSIGLLTTSYT